MPTNFNTNPYYDDFTEGKSFYRILFKPGRAVQARELTQIQTILQNQIKRFGQNILKESSLVIPGHSAVDRYAKYAKLTSSYNSVDTDDVLEDLLGVELTGQTSGVKAKVIDYELTSDSDPPTLYLKYLNSGTSKTQSGFSDDEVLVNSGSTISVKTISSNSTGTGIRFSIQEGVMFIRGYFAFFDTQDILISKYSSTVSKSVGFKITESIITSDEDESLLDPAAGSYNYFAPGADRFKIELALNVRDIGDYSSDPDFIELAKIENGELIALKRTAEYNILGDTLARRTYDESGNYTVRPYSLEVTNHLRTSNSTIRDGIYTSELGGNSQLYVGVINPGKAYVLGYEIEDIKTKYIEIPKSRDTVSVNNGVVPIDIGNYILIEGVYSVPDISSMSTVSLYNRKTSAAGSSNGNLVGTARPRALEYYSGSGSSTIFKLYLFDIQMTPPYVFERDVKQVYFNNDGFNDFTSNVVSTNNLLTGTLNFLAGSSVITGSGTRFTTELKANNYIQIGSSSSNVFIVSNIVNDYQLNATYSSVYSANGLSGYRQDSNIFYPEDSSYIIEIPYSNIKTVDPTDLETSYYTRRVYDRTLSTGNISITAGTNEVFNAFTSDDYVVINKTTGAVVPLYSANISLSGSPTGKTITLNLGSSFGSNEIRFFTTVYKTNNAADKKVKTLTSTSLDFTSNSNATATLNLARADVYEVSNVLMSANAFGTAFAATNSTDITSRYTFDNGQRRTHYDIASLTLKPGQPSPTGPVRVYYSYFTHSAGDYCSVDSYSDLTYEQIPSFKDGTKIYQLRDCIDFRPVIDTSGNTFTTPTEFPKQTSFFTTDYEYYLGRIDKIVVNPSGNIFYVSGPSSLTPVEPTTPENSMALFVLKQNPYVFDVKKDIDVSVVDNRRFTMRDIGRIENRVKNLEYYTELSLLELDQKVFSIKDNEGFDRFKNGFVVDNFTGHAIGDATNPDYSISMDLNEGYIRPLYVNINVPLKEICTTDSQRTSNHYAITGNTVSLPYTNEIFIQSNVASRVENVNPFEVIKNVGDIQLDPPADYWFESNKLPDIYIDQEGTFDTLQSDSAAKGTFNTIWNAWEVVWSGGVRQEQRTGTTYKTYEKIDTVTNNDIVVSKVIIPKMRSVNINFVAKGLKPNTKLKAFFENFDVTNFCKGKYTSSSTLLSDSNVYLRTNDVLNTSVTNFGNLFTDINGTIEGTFNYQSNFFNLNTGEKRFTLTDSPTNSDDSETIASTIFISSGESRQVRNEIVSTRYTYSTQEQVYENRNSSGQSSPPVSTIVNTYLPSSDLVSTTVINNNNNWNPLDEQTNAVKSTTGLNLGLEDIRVLEAADESIQNNLLAATTGASAATVKSTTVSYFNNDGSVKWDVLSPALFNSSWSSGMGAEAKNQLQSAKDSYVDTIKIGLKDAQSGTYAEPEKGSILADMVDALNHWKDNPGGPLDNFISATNMGEPGGMSVTDLAIHLSASLVTVAGAASQAGTLDPDNAKWVNMMDNIVTGNQKGRV